MNDAGDDTNGVVAGMSVPARAQLRQLVVDSVSSPRSRRAYGKAVDDFVAWLVDVAGDGRPRPFAKATLQEYRASLEARRLAPATINARLAPLRKLASEAADNGLLDPARAAGIARVRGVRRLGVRLGQWLSAEQATALLAVPDPATLRGLRDRAILAVLVGCLLRRSELVALDVEDLQEREGRAVFVDIRGKGGRMRTVPIPSWVLDVLKAWIAEAAIAEGKLFRRIRRGGAIGSGLSDSAVWAIVKASGHAIGVELGSHDLRRTGAKLCRAAGGALEQLQFLLGHASIETTERYLGGTQELAVAVNDRMPALVRRGRA